VDVLDERGGLPLEVERVLPLEGDRLCGLFRDDVVPDRTDPDLVGDALHVLLGEVVVADPVVHPGLDRLAGAVDRLVEQIVEHHAGTRRVDIFPSGRLTYE